METPPPLPFSIFQFENYSDIYNQSMAEKYMSPTWLRPKQRPAYIKPHKKAKKENAGISYMIYTQKKEKNFCNNS